MEGEKRSEKEVKQVCGIKSSCYYYSLAVLQKPYQLIGDVGRAILRFLGFSKKDSSHQIHQKGGVGGSSSGSGSRGGESNFTSTETPVVTSNVRSYTGAIRTRAPPLHEINPGKPAQHH